MELPSANTTNNELFGPGLGETQRAVLTAIKRAGPTTQSMISREVPHAPATLREHLRSLTLLGLVERRGSHRSKRGRPEVIYALTPRAEALFPNQEPAVLKELVLFLDGHGHGGLLEEFFAARLAERLPAARARVRRLRGAARFQEVARILSEAGFLALAGGTPRCPSLRLCHCPLRGLVRVSSLPCRYEQSLIADLLGRSLTRDEYIPDGQASCSYHLTQQAHLSEESV